MSPENPENKTPDSTENEPAPVNGASRFSEDDMDTEIEVTPDEVAEEKPRRKKKKKSSDQLTEGDGEPRETSAERRERRRKKKEKKRAKEAEKEATETSPPPYSLNDDDDDKKKNKKKKNYKKKMNNLLDTPLLFAAGVFVCVILPFSIYACDVIISVNVIDTENYRDAIISAENDFTLLPDPEKLTGKSYTIEETIFMTIQINQKLESRKRVGRAISEEEANSRQNSPVILVAQDPTNPPTVNNPTEEVVELTSTSTSTTTPTTTLSTTSSTPPTSVVSLTTSGDKSESPGNTTKPTNATVTSFELAENTTGRAANTTIITTTLKSKKPAKFHPKPISTLSTTTTTTEATNTTAMDPEPWKQQPGEFCRGLYYFYESHLSYAYEYHSDWFVDQTSSVYQKEQALFFLFTIFGFIFLLASLALRCDAFLSDEWSSFLMLQFLLYSISMALTVAVFGQESSNNGLRCATCRFTSNCTDIDPWDYTTHWPADPDNVQWSLVALLSFIFKLVDCYAIAIVTLRFILDFTRDYWWITFLKIFGWMLVFPLLIFTPMLGVIRYQVLPGVVSDDDASYMAVQVLFYIGVVFWAICLGALPFLCKMRMCSGSEEMEKAEDEEEYQ